MKTGTAVGFVLLVFLVVFILVNLLIWYIVSRQLYVKSIRPGDMYKVGERIYQVPKLPLEGDAQLLNEDYLIKQHDLLHIVTHVLETMNIQYWISGGTLLGFVRHRTFIPWDDDCDLHTHWKNRDYMFSHQFGEDIKPYGLEAIFLLGASTKFVTRQAAAVRIRKQKTLTPVCDIFFVKETEDGIFAKVDSWSGENVTFNSTEQWTEGELFPTKRKTVDGLDLMFPNNPVKTLETQYGKNVLTHMYARNVLFSHLYPFSVIRWVWETH